MNIYIPFYTIICARHLLNFGERTHQIMEYKWAEDRTETIPRRYPYTSIYSLPTRSPYRFPFSFVIHRHRSTAFSVRTVELKTEHSDTHTHPFTTDYKITISFPIRICHPPLLLFPFELFYPTRLSCPSQMKAKADNVPQMLYFSVQHYMCNVWKIFAVLRGILCSYINIILMNFGELKMNMKYYFAQLTR